MHVLLSAAADVLAAVPDPGQGEAPPGSEGFLKILRYCAYIALGVCVLGVIGAGAGMAMQNRGHGNEGAQHAGRLGWVMGGAITIGSAAALIAAVLPA